MVGRRLMEGLYQDPSDVRDRLIRALRPTVPGAEWGNRVRLLGVSSEIGLRVTLMVDGECEIHVEIAPDEESPRAAVRAAGLAFSYRAETVGRAVPDRLGIAVCKLVADRLAPRSDELRAAAAPPGGEERVREITVERLLERAFAGRRPILTLSPYVGCPIGCRFCYAQRKVAGVRRLEGLPLWPWGSFLDVRINSPEILARELRAAPDGEAGWPIKFCPIVSDPYPPIERSTRLTRRCLEVLRDQQPGRPVLILSRSALLARDVDVLAALPRAWAGASIPTLDDAVRRHFEPRAAPIAERLAALATLRAAGVRTFAVVQPVLPGGGPDPIAALADALAAVVSSVRVDRLRGVEGAAEEFSDPAYSEIQTEAWQQARAAELAEALRARGVTLWPDELPSELEVDA